MSANTPAKQLADLLVTHNFEPEMLDSSGKAAPSPDDAEIFSFNFITDNGTDHGTVVIMLGDDNNLTVFSGDNVGRGMDSEDKNQWYEFQHQLKNFATRNFLTFGSQSINKLKYSMQGQAALKEGLFESWNGTKNVSWNGNPDSVRLMIKHRRPIGVNEARFRQIESLFVETAEGERYKLPFRNLSGGRAMVEHVRQGGKPYDMRGAHIANMVEELNVLSRFRRASKGQVFEGDTAQLVDNTNKYYETMNRTLKGLSSSRGYNKYFESWNPADITEQDVIIENIKTLFVQETIDSRIEQALPILARIQQGNVMKEANIFEAWADRLVEGTWSIPNTPEQQQELITLMSKEFPVGADAINATEQLYNLFGDDQLFDDLQELAATDANADARPLIMDRMREVADFDSSISEILAALENGSEEPPFEGPYSDKKIATPGKHGYGPSAAKHLAKQGMQSVSEEELNEGKVKQMMMDLEELSDEEFQVKYHMTKEEARKGLGGEEPVNEQDIAEGTSLDKLLAHYPEEVEHFKQGGDLDYDLESALWDHYFNSGEIRNYDADASEWIAQRLADELGVAEGLMDKIKSGAKKLANVVAPDDDTLVKDLARRAGVPGKDPRVLSKELQKKHPGDPDNFVRGGKELGIFKEANEDNHFLSRLQELSGLKK